MKLTSDRDKPIKSTGVNIVKTNKKPETTVTERYSTYQCFIENSYHPGEVEEKQMTYANFVFDEGSQ